MQHFNINDTIKRVEKDIRQRFELWYTLKSNAQLANTYKNLLLKAWHRIHTTEGEDILNYLKSKI